MAKRKQTKKQLELALRKTRKELRSAKQVARSIGYLRECVSELRERASLTRRFIADLNRYFGEVRWQEAVDRVLAIELRRQIERASAN